jgi:hypothetical protein
MVFLVITSFSDETTASFFMGVNSLGCSYKVSNEPTLGNYILAVRGILMIFFFVIQVQ